MREAVITGVQGQPGYGVKAKSSGWSWERVGNHTSAVVTVDPAGLEGNVHTVLVLWFLLFLCVSFPISGGKRLINKHGLV